MAQRKPSTIARGHRSGNNKTEWATNKREAATKKPQTQARGMGSTNFQTRTILSPRRTVSKEILDIIRECLPNGIIPAPSPLAAIEQDFNHVNQIMQLEAKFTREMSRLNSFFVQYFFLCSPVDPDGNEIFLTHKIAPLRRPRDVNAGPRFVSSPWIFCDVYDRRVLFVLLLQASHRLTGSTGPEAPDMRAKAMDQMNRDGLDWLNVGEDFDYIQYLEDKGTRVSRSLPPFGRRWSSRTRCFPQNLQRF